MALDKPWWTCDGREHGEEIPPLRVNPYVSRRGFIGAAALGAVSWLAANRALSQLTVGRKPGARNVLVSIFLRGGADGLNMLTPYGEDAYHRNRPQLGLPNPGAKDGVLDLDGFFGLNPALAPLLPLYREGRLGIIHACGSLDRTRSHFEAMNAMERGLDGINDGPASGWLARHLMTTSGSATPLRAVALGRTMPDSLRGATNALAMEDLSEFRLNADESARRALAALYADGKDPLTSAGRETLEVLGTLARLNPKAYAPSVGYPASDLGRALQQVAFLIKADVGLEVACLDKGGWDTHYGQNLAGLLTGLLDDLGKSLAAFAADMGPDLPRVTVLVQTEFGRRVKENQSLGTDHGRGSAMFVLGGGVQGGRIYGRWPGLEDHQLDEVGDLRVTTDYRSVLSEVLSKRLGSSPASVFGASFPGLGLFSPSLDGRGRGAGDRRALEPGTDDRQGSSPSP